MQCVATEIADVIEITPQVHGDRRGFFKEVWHRTRFAAAGLDMEFVQDNQSRSAQGTLRGLHFQARQPQGKLVQALAGEIFDVAVDLRRSSPDFGRWTGRLLSAERHNMLWVPAGFAHGFYVISDYADVAYKCTDFYAPEHERELLWNDADVGIAWPLVDGRPPLLSAKDARGTRFAELEFFP